jgi:hypothetical protein
MTKEQLLQRALDALGPAAPTCCGCVAEWEIAITAIKEALTQPEQEPVAWAYVNSDDECEQIEYCTESPMPEFVPLYTSPPKRQPLSHKQFQVLNFLIGHSHIEGVFFNEKHPNKKGAFWWRSVLQDAFPGFEAQFINHIKGLK